MSQIFSVGGINIAINQADEDTVPPRLKPFRVHSAKTQASCTGTIGPLARIPARIDCFDSGGVWCVAQTTRGFLLALRKGPHPGQPYHLLELDPSLCQGEVTLDPTDLEDGRSPFLLRDPMHELWTSFLLMRGMGLMLHGCGLLRDGKVHIFLGASGAGKSTLAAILDQAAQGTILSDDRLILRPEGENFRVYGTPWHGSGRFASPDSGLLASVCFLHHAPFSQKATLSPAQAIRELFRVCFVAGWPRTDITSVLELCQLVATNTPCGRLEFRPDGSVLEALGLDVDHETSHITSPTTCRPGQ